ncbi:MAG: hypothetical protein J7K15_12230 [Deltaproteobacteria bacterium]|nr:hypothetical protein [Deltaproteobacteria bacterium]
MELFVIDSFFGLNTEDVPQALHPGTAVQATDVDFRDPRGAIRGLPKHLLAYSCGPVNHIAPYLGTVVYTTGTKLYADGTEIKSDWGGRFTHDIIDGVLVMANGDSVIKYDSSNVYNFGIDQPTLGSFAAAGSGTGSFTVGNWQYVTTFVNGSGFESIPSTAITVSSQGSGKDHVAVTGIPIGDDADNVTARRLYRTTDGGATFYLLTQINNNTATTYSDTTTDDDLGTSSPPTTHYKIEQSVTMLRRVERRLFAAGSSSYPRRLWFSLPSPYSEGWPLTYYEDFPTTIIGIEALGNNLIVLTEDGPFALMNTDNPTSMYYQELTNRTPADSKWGSCQVINRVYWKGPQGIFVTNGISVYEDSRNVRKLFSISNKSCEIETDSDSNLYVALDMYDANVEKGRIVRLQSDEDTYTFSAEVGRIVAISGLNSYSFSSETGRILSLGAARPVLGSVLTRIQRNDQTVYWGTSSEKVFTFGNDKTNRILYAGKTNGVYKAFTDTERNSWTWQSVTSHLGFPGKRKRLVQVSIIYKGTITVSIIGDDETLHTKTLTSEDKTTGKVIMPGDSWAYMFSLKIEGESTGIVYPSVIYYFEVERTL